MSERTMLRIGLGSVLVAATLGLAGCGLFTAGGEEAPPEPTAPARALVPTFTPTPAGEAPPTATPPAPPPTQVIVVEAAVPAAAEPAAVGTAAPVAEAATPTPAVTPGLEVEEADVNVRLGPGTEFGLAGTVENGAKFPIVGRNGDKTWYLICCVNGQEVWINAELTDEENEELAVEVTPAVVAAQPAAATPAPVAAAPAPAPAEPTATPAPPAPPPVADACAGIGGDGCKFKLRGGPQFAPNGGTELKFQLSFVHSGIEGGQPQASYFVWVEKDGQKLPIADSQRSILQSQQGMLGRYNYEYKVGLGDIPGNNVAGNYVIWVLDGNGERDSQTFNFSVPDGQGEVWMEFDQG